MLEEAGGAGERGSGGRGGEEEGRKEGVGGGDTGEGRYSRMKTFRARTKREKRMLIYRDAMMPRVQQKDISLGKPVIVTSIAGYSGFFIMLVN